MNGTTQRNVAQSGAAFQQLRKELQLFSNSNSGKHDEQLMDGEWWSGLRDFVSSVVVGGKSNNDSIIRYEIELHEPLTTSRACRLLREISAHTPEHKFLCDAIMGGYSAVFVVERKEVEQ